MIVLLPLYPLVAAMLGPSISRWPRGQVLWFLSSLFAVTLATNHLHALRMFSAGMVPDWMSAVAHWIAAVFIRIILPLALLVVLLAWASTRHTWHILDVAAVHSGGIVLLFACFLSSAGHPFDRVSPEASGIWLSLTCYVFPAVLLIVPVILCIRSKLKGRTH